MGACQLLSFGVCGLTTGLRRSPARVDSENRPDALAVTEAGCSGVEASSGALAVSPTVVFCKGAAKVRTTGGRRRHRLQPTGRFPQKFSCANLTLANASDAAYTTGGGAHSECRRQFAELDVAGDVCSL